MGIYINNLERLLLLNKEGDIILNGNMALYSVEISILIDKIISFLPKLS
jgi:hypothetical protein